MVKKMIVTGMMISLLRLCFAVAAQGPSSIEVGKFSAESVEKKLPEGWKPQLFKGIERHTTYTLVKDGETTVVKAVANQSASLLIREIKIDPKEYPIVQWRWKISNILQKADVHTKEGDDYPARLYITFEYDSSKVSFFEKFKFDTIRLFYGRYPPLAALNYIWESKAPVGAILPNAYTNRAMMIVVESGPEKLNEWIHEERNVYEDYRKAFGEGPPMISGVAIMTDTDNTGESATAYYGDIVFKKGGL
jgi:hypothetical protein